MPFTGLTESDGWLGRMTGEGKKSMLSVFFDDDDW